MTVKAVLFLALVLMAVQSVLSARRRKCKSKQDLCSRLDAIMKSEDCKVHLEDKWASENEKLQEKNKKLRDEKAALVRELERMEKERLQSGESLKHEMEICQEHVAQTEELKNQLESCESGRDGDRKAVIHHFHKLRELRKKWTYHSLGCFDVPGQAPALQKVAVKNVLAGKDEKSRGNHATVPLCFMAAVEQDLRAFALVGGDCFVAADRQNIEDSFESAAGCHANGKGGHMVMEAYEIVPGSGVKHGQYREKAKGKGREGHGDDEDDDRKK